MENRKTHKDGEFPGNGSPVLSIGVASAGALDDVPIDLISKFEQGVLRYLRAEHAEFVAEIEADKSMPEKRIKRLGFLAKEYRDSQWKDDLKHSG